MRRTIILVILPKTLSRLMLRVLSEKIWFSKCCSFNSYVRSTRNVQNSQLVCSKIFVLQTNLSLFSCPSTAFSFSKVRITCVDLKNILSTCIRLPLLSDIVESGPFYYYCTSYSTITGLFFKKKSFVYSAELIYPFSYQGFIYWEFLFQKFEKWTVYPNYLRYNFTPKQLLWACIMHHIPLSNVMKETIVLRGLQYSNVTRARKTE